MNASKLNEIINQRGFKKIYVAKELGITPASLSQKMKGVVEFKLSEVHKLCKLLNISDKLMIEIFFN